MYDINEIKLNADNSKNSNIYKVNIPYNTKMLMQECESMNISMRLITTEDAVNKDLKISSKQFKPQDSSIRIKSSKKTDIFNIEDISIDKLFKIGDIVIITKKGKYNNSEAEIIKILGGNLYQLEITYNKDYALNNKKVKSPSSQCGTPD